MNNLAKLQTAAVIAGLASGPSALKAASQSQPPLTEGDLMLVFGGSIVGVFFIVGMQAAVKNNKAFVWGWQFLAIVGACIVSAGLCALVVAFVQEGVRPHAFLFIAMGAAMLVGLIALRVLFRGRFERAA